MRPVCPWMKGLQSKAEGMTACKTTGRTSKHRNGEQWRTTIWCEVMAHWQCRLNLQCCMFFIWFNTLRLYLIAWIRGNLSGSVSSSQIARKVSPLGSVILIKLMRREKFFCMMRNVASVGILSVGIVLTSTEILNGIWSCWVWMEAMAILPGLSSRKWMVPHEPASLLSAFIAGPDWSGDRCFRNKILDCCKTHFAQSCTRSMTDTHNIEWSHAMHSSQLSTQQLVQRTATWQGHNQKKARTTKVHRGFQN